MSQENALVFIRRVYDDDTLMAKLVPLGYEDMDGLLRVAAEAGFDDFSADDYLAAAQRWTNVRDTELADSDLDLIAGGANIFVYKTNCAPYLSCD